jgi:hypothetical protein
MWGEDAPVWAHLSPRIFTDLLPTRSDQPTRLRSPRLAAQSNGRDCPGVTEEYPIRRSCGRRVPAKSAPVGAT